jgi:hypothetical protein
MEVVMLELIDIDIDNAVAFRVSGKVTEADMSLVLERAGEKVDQYGDIVFFEQIDSFDGIEVAAIINEFTYLFDMGLSNIKKVAVLTDKKWIESVAKIESKLFAGVQVRCFSTDDQLSAILFLKECSS